jgi:uncharacterized protein with FMN-binding domain
MRRAIITMTGTVVGLAALLSFKTHTVTVADTTPAAPPVTASSSPAASNTAAPAASGSAAPAASGSSSAQAAPAAQAARKITGAVENTQYGPMQVQLTVTGTKITDATVLQHTDDGAESMQIDGFALPALTKETLAAQSAKIDAVSGASYTSMGYIASLQSAVDQIG